MGFIDYHGTKEDRYDEVLQYSRDQQEDYKKLRLEQTVNNWLKEKMKLDQFVELKINDAIKLIIGYFTKLTDIKDELISVNTDSSVDSKTFWGDFASYVIYNHLESFDLDAEKRNNIYSTFATKVFKLTDYIEADIFYSSMSSSSKFKVYIGRNFDLTQDKLFWKWIGKISRDKRTLLSDFIDSYEKLTVLMGYYLFLGTHEKSNVWMKRLEVEKTFLAKLREDYAKKKMTTPNTSNMHNPLYKPKISEPTIESSINTTNNITDLSKEIVVTTKEEKKIKTKLRVDRAQLDRLLEKKNLTAYIKACELLMSYCLPKKFEVIYEELVNRIDVLNGSIKKYEDVYQTDLFMFYDYYIPEVIHLTASYLEYLDVGISEHILSENEVELLDALKKLIIAVNEKIDEIYRYASIYLKAKAKAVESMMTQDGYVNPEYKISNDGGK